MNLYKSFGNLMEAWINEEKTTGSEWIKSNAEDSGTFSSDIGPNPRSESVDSGVETASWGTPCPASSCSVSANNAEGDLFSEENEEPSSGSFIPSCSPSSSPQLCTKETKKVDLHLKVEQALERLNSKSVKREDEPKCQPPKTSFLSEMHTPKSRECQRSASLGPRQKVAKQMPEKQQRPLSIGFYNLGSEDLSVKGKKELSPGLCYLEQVCQKLEEMARQQMHNQALLMETNAKCPQDIQKTCERNFPASDATCHRLENAGNADGVSTERKQRKYGHLQLRSFSDANIATMHLRDQQGTHEQLNVKEENVKPQVLIKENLGTTKYSFRNKFLSLKRDVPPAADTASQPSCSTEKSSTRRRLTQLMRGRRKTQPI